MDISPAAGHPLQVLRLERLLQLPPPLAAWWRLYLWRFALDPGYRFAKQCLYRPLPRLKTPEQAER